METLRSARIGLLLSVILIARPVGGEPAGRPKGPSAGGSASVLLQEGLYAEEIEGDLDGAIKIYEQVLAKAKDIEQAAAQATYRIGMCFLKKGDKAKAAEHFQSIVREYRNNEQLVARAKEQLNKLGTPAEVPFSSTAASLYEKLPPEVIQFVGNKYGSICAEARAKELYSNSHVYYVASDFVLFKGGMGYYHNLSDKALFNKIRLGGTSEPNQTHYDIAGREMNTEIVPDKISSDFYHIYWTPHQPVPPGEMFYYGWCIDKAKQLRPAAFQDPASGSAQYKLTMQNQFGNRVVETFFLVVPVNTSIISRTEDYTAKDTIAGFDVYCFSKEVPEDANHQVDVVLAGPGPAETKANLYEHLPTAVLAHIGGKYGGISSEAAAKDLYSNSHIYYVTSDWVLLTGGMGYYRNGSNEARTERVRLSGTSSPNQTLYDVAGRQMNIEIVQDKVRQGFYHIYWTPSEAIPPGQMFYYGWSNDQSRPLQPAAGAGQYTLTMQNHFGERVIETFFLVVPEGSRLISKTEDFTAKDTVGGFDIYYWSKEVPTNTNNKIDILLAASADGTLFGPVQTATICDIDHRKTKGKHCTIDLDTGLTGKLPVEQFEASSMDMERYLADEGVDAVGEFAQNKASLIALGMVVEVKPPEAWDNLTAAELLGSLSGRRNAAAETTIMQWNDQGEQSVFAFSTREGAMGLLQILSADETAQRFELRYKMLQKEQTKSPIDLSAPEATIKSFVKAVYDGNLEAARACACKDGHDYDEFKEMLATESNHPFQAMIKAMDVSIPVEITSKSIKDGKCKISWYLTLGRVYYFGETKMKKGTHQEFSSYLELVGDKWLIRDI